MPRNSWAAKSCLVTGASAGLGRHVAAALVRRGARVLLCARKADALEAVAAELREQGGRVATIAADVTWQDDVDRLAAAAGSEFGGLDCLVHCAGRSTRGGLVETTPEDMQQLFDVNCLSAVRLARAFGATLVDRKGSLVLIGSLASKTALPYLGGYPASKHALAAVAQQLRLELGPRGMHTLLVCPGPIARDDAGARYAEQSAGLPPAAAQPGGGAKLTALDPQRLAEQILDACERRQDELVVPWKARLLFAVAALNPRWGDWLLRKNSSSDKEQP